MWSLIVESGKHKGRRVRLVADRVVIGRAEDAQIRVGSTDVSRYHCELLPTAHGVLVNDLESRNGTLINGEVISTEFLLAPGNMLTVGPMSFRLLPKIPRRSDREKDDQRLSDDEISDWLQENVAALQSDTTVIGRSADEESTEIDPTAGAPADSGPWVPPPSKQKFDSIAQEAADIIRRHHEMVAAMDADDQK